MQEISNSRVYRNAPRAARPLQQWRPTRALAATLLLLVGLGGGGSARGQISLPPDVRVEGLALALRQNGALVPIPPGGAPIPFFPSDTLALHIQLATSIDTPTLAASSAFDNAFEWVGRECPEIDCEIIDTFALGVVRVEGATEIGSRNPLQQAHIDATIDFDGIFFSLFALGQANQGHDVQLRVIADSSNEISEFVESNNTRLAQTVVNLVPVNAVSVVRIGPIELEPISLQLAPNPGGCSGENPVWITSGTAWWEVASNGSWDATEVTLVPNCGNLVVDAAGNRFVLEVTWGAATEVSGSLGGIEVSSASVLLNENGALPGSLEVALPDHHSVHAPDLSGHPIPRGSSELVLTSFPSGAVADFADLVASRPSGDRLQVGALPFTLPLESFVIDATGIHGSHGPPIYAYAYPYAPGDLREASRRGPRSNDARYRAPAPGSNSYAIGPAGLLASLPFGQGDGRSHYPRTQIAFAAFDLTIEDGAIAGDSLLPAAGLYYFRQSTACAACPPSGDSRPTFELSPDAEQGLASDGAVMAWLDESGANPAWGPFDEDFSQLFVFERNDDFEQPGVLYLPGFVASGSGGPDEAPAVESLLGMRRSEAGADGAVRPGSHALLSSSESRRGNGFAAGLNLGPELLRPGSGVPTAGEGTLLTDTTMWVGFGGFGGDIPTSFRLVTTNEGTKLNVRPRGVTGVFNTSTPPQPTLYDFTTSLRRFAIRTISNELDPYTWIDGLVQVPGAGDFEIAFSSLELLCTGDIGSGLVDRENCDDADPDSNDNGLDDENCDEHLGAWNTRIEELISLRFVPEEPDATFCDGGDRLLEMGSSVDVVALDEPIGLISQWYPDGEPGEAFVTGDTDRVYDRPSDDAEGFRVALGDQIALHHTDAQDGWWYVSRVSHNVSLWDAIEAGVRFRNQSEDSQGQTVVGPPDAAFVTDANRSNDEVAPEMDSAAGELLAHYLWANRFDIGLPVVFQADRHGYAEPRFAGHVQDQSLVVLTARANVDFIDPAATKASLGVSADLSSAGILSELSSLSGLVSGVLGFDIEGFLQPLRTASDALVRVAGSGFGGYLEEALRDELDASIGSGAGPGASLHELTGALVKINALPGRLAGQLSGPVEEQVDLLTAPLQDPQLDAIVLDVGANLPQALEDAILVSPDTTLLDDFEEGLIRLRDALGQVEEQELALAQALADLESALAGLSLSAETAESVQAGTDAIQSLLDNGLGLPACGPDHPVIARIAEFQGRMETLGQVLGTFELIDLASALPGLSEEQQTSLASAQQDIRDLVEDARERIAAVNGVLDGVPGVLDGVTGCGGVVSYANLGDSELVGWLEAIQAQLANVDGLVSLTETTLSGDGGLLQQVADELGAAFGEVREKLETVQKLIDWVVMARQGVADFEGLGSEAEISSWLDDRGWLVGGADPFTAVLREQLSEPIQSTLGVAAFTGTFLPLLGQQDVIGQSHTTDSLMDVYLDHLMNDDEVERVEAEIFEHLDELVDGLAVVDGLLMEQVNALVRSLASAGSAELAAVLGASQAQFEGQDGGASVPWNLFAANLDGSVLVEGDDIALLRVDGDFSVGSDDERASFGFGAGLLVESWSHSGKDEGCPAIPESGGFLDVTIEARNLPFRLGPGNARIKRVAIGFTLGDSGDHLAALGAAGGVEITGRIGTVSVALVDPAFAAAFGRYENAIGFSGLVFVDDVSAKGGFLAGNTCNRDLLRTLDPQVDDFIGDLIGDNFSGLYVRTGISAVIWDNGCALELGVGVDVGGWFLITGEAPEQPLDFINNITIGGLYGGSIFGTGACLVNLRGGITLGATITTEQVLMSGSAWGVAGLGICSPSSWASVSASRSDDPLCGTVDAEMEANATVYLQSVIHGDIGGAFEYEIDDPSFGGFH